MTATLPSHLQTLLTNLFGSIALLRPGKDVLGKPARHRLRLMPEGVDVLNGFSIAAIEEAAKSGSVLVVVNQVERARKLWRVLANGHNDVHLLHSRFTHQDRTRKEQQIEPSPGKILVATQAVEVSLDLDYDTCFSELAPLESLLQRFGRCNRKGKKAEAIVNVFRAFPSTGQKPYAPYCEDHLKTTLSALEVFVVRNCPGVLAEEQMQALLDASYPEALKKQMEVQIESKINDLNKHFVEPFVPFGLKDENIARGLDLEWQKLFDGEEVLPKDLRQQALNETSWLGRARYLVPISGLRFAQLWRDQKICWDNETMCNVVDVPYSEEGLHV